VVVVLFFPFLNSQDLASAGKPDAHLLPPQFLNQGNFGNAENLTIASKKPGERNSRDEHITWRFKYVDNCDLILVLGGGGGGGTNKKIMFE